ncbi:MAG: DUF3710 domain-containing protein [Actinomycetaceae bacterium]|nr:DUF3710 domain-containing protein [Actinomycetaceae bacterium]
MAWFKRKSNKNTDETTGVVETEAPREELAGGTDDTRGVRGPWDRDDEAAATMPRVSFGALEIPVIQGMQVAPVPNPHDPSQILALEVIIGAAQMQVAAVATRRSGGGWEQILEEFPPLFEGEGCSVERVEGEREQLLITPPEGVEGAMPILVDGHQGSGWFLRVLYRGAAATDPYARASLEELVSGCLVSRGEELLTPGEPIPLTLPQVEPQEPTSTHEA